MPTVAEMVAQSHARAREREERLDARRRSIDAKYRAHPALRRPLAYGDAEQIKALHEWRRAHEQVDEDAEKLRTNGDLSVWEITYERHVDGIATVIATSEEEARQLLDLESNIWSIGRARCVGAAEPGDEPGVEDMDDDD